MHEADVGAEACSRSGLSLALPVLVTIKVKEFNEAGGEGLMRYDRLQKYGVFYEGVLTLRLGRRSNVTAACRTLFMALSFAETSPKFRRASKTKLTD